MPIVFRFRFVFTTSKKQSILISNSQLLNTIIFILRGIYVFDLTNTNARVS
jgi:hypothetical protein